VALISTSFNFVDVIAVSSMLAAPGRRAAVVLNRGETGPDLVGRAAVPVLAARP
jgi:hypothetical protein